MHADRLLPLTVPLFGSQIAPVRWVFWGARALRWAWGGETCFLTTFGRVAIAQRLRNGCAAAQRQLLLSCHISDSNSAGVEQQPASVARIPSGASAHRDDSAQRQTESIDWTPALPLRNNLSNHSSVRPGPAFTPGSSSTPTVHLQTAARNTHQPPSLHRYHHVACCHTL
jgi:hypothetical protein